MYFNLLLGGTSPHLLKGRGGHDASIREDVALLGQFFWGFADSEERELLLLAVIDRSDCGIIGKSNPVGDHLIADFRLFVRLGVVVAKEAVDLAVGLAEGHSDG